MRRFPVLARIGQFFGNYARKATVGGGIGATLTTLLAQQDVPTDTANTLLERVAGLPWWLQFIIAFGGFFASIYFPPNK